MTNLHDVFHQHAIREFARKAKEGGLLPSLTEDHIPHILDKTKHPLNLFSNHILNLPHTGIVTKQKLPTGIVGGNLATDAHLKYAHGGRVIGGRIMPGGGFGTGTWDVPNTNQEMYHFLLLMSPHQLEMFREIASQILGGHHSPMWGKLVKANEKMEADSEDYENIIRMPNQHAAARLLEAEAGGGWGKFGKALKHVGRIAHKIYKAGSHVVDFANTNKDLIRNLVPDKYQGGFDTVLETANKVKNAVDPMVEVASELTKDNPSEEAKQKLKAMAEQGLDSAVAKFLPEKQETYNQIKEAAKVIGTGNKEQIADYAVGKVKEHAHKSNNKKLKAAVELGENVASAYKKRNTEIEDI